MRFDETLIVTVKIMDISIFEAAEELSNVTSKREPESKELDHTMRHRFNSIINPPFHWRKSPSQGTKLEFIELTQNGNLFAS